MPQKGCPNCHKNHWIVCPKCNDYYCYQCGLNSNGVKRKANNHCASCNYIGHGWKTTVNCPGWATFK